MKVPLRIAETTEALNTFLEDTVRTSELKLQRIRLSDQDQWAMKQGVLSHFSNGFFHVAGLRNQRSQEEHLVLYQPQSALTGLAIFRENHQVYVLLQARVEPGLSNIGQYGPTIQSTAANYMRMHGGNKTSYLELFRSFSPIANPLANNIQFDLGKRYFQKNKILSYLELDTLIETEENMIWVPLQVVAEEVARDNYLNPDLRSLLSCFDWDLFRESYDAGGQTAPAQRASGLDFPANLLGNNEWRLVTLDELAGWDVQDESIADVSESGIWVDIYHVSCFNREVRAWTQPLMSCSSRGLVILFVRKVEERFEFLVSIDSEFGISGQRTVLPSIAVYPGDSHNTSIGLSGTEILLAEMAQSEEGGRFYNNESLYQVHLITEDFDTTPQQQWVTSETLKSILKSSTTASIQLRCIASLVLDLINPHSFS